MTKINVLVIEDDQRIATIVANTINKREEYEVVGIASNSDDAIEFLANFAPQLVFLDISLNESSGLDVMKYLRQERTDDNIHVVMLTAAKDVEVIQTSMAHGVFDYILKPISFSRLNLTLQRFAQYSEKVANSASLEQADLDLCFGNQADEPSEPSKVPKGIDPITLDKVRTVMKEDISIAFTADAMADRIGTSRTTARRYLEFLLGSNEVRADIQYGTVGRPERRYLCAKY